MEDDYVRAVAKAYGERDPRFHEVVKRQLDAIKAAEGRLANQAHTIRQLASLVAAPASTTPKAQAVPTLTQLLTEAVTSMTNGAAYLSDDQKNLARELWEAEKRRSGRDLQAQEIVDLMRGSGVKFLVAQPAPALGMTLAAARRAWAASHPEVTNKTEAR